MSAISFLAGLGAGYLQETDKQDERKRRDKLDQITIDRAQRDTDTYNEQRDNRAAIRTAAAPLPVETVDGVGPPDEDGTTPRTSYRVGAAQFADQGAATTAANDPTARDARIASTIRGIDPAQAQQFESGTKQAKLTDVQLQQHIRAAQDEGAMRALNVALSGGSAADVEASFNASGKTKVHNLQITPIEVNHPVLGKQPSVKISGVRDDGTPFELPDALDASFKLFSAEKQFGMLVDAKKDATKTAQEDRKITTAEAAQKSLSRYHDAIADAAGVRATNSGAGKVRADPVERMSEADKEEYKGIKDQVKSINAEITKAQASDSWNDTSENAKRLRTQVAALNLRGKVILDRYAAEDDAPDPVGLRKPAAGAGASPTQVDPATQDARDVAAGKQMVMTEFGGDVGRARSELAAMQDGIRKAPSGEAKAMLQSQARRLQLGINSMGTAPAPARIAAGGVAAPPAAAPVAAAPVVPQGSKPTGDTTLNAIQSSNLASLAPLTDAVVQAKQQLAAVAKSGDPAALARYATALQQARDARAAAAQAKLGNNAPQYLASVEP